MVYHLQPSGLKTIRMKTTALERQREAARIACLFLLCATAACTVDSVRAQPCTDRVEVQVTFEPGRAQIDETKSSRALYKTASFGSLHQLGVTRLTPQRTVRVAMVTAEGCARQI